MNELFTVDYALNYESWTYAKDIAPYNVYTLDQFTIKVRRNDFYLVLHITNACNKVVFYGRIYTIDEYKVKVKRHLFKWKCRPITNTNPNPSSQPPVVLPLIINLNYPQGSPLPTSNIGEVFNEQCEIIGGPVYNPTVNVTYAMSASFPQYLTITGIVQYTLGTFTNVLLCRGLVSNIIFSTTINTTIYSITPPSPFGLILEDGDRILLENSDLILIE